MNGFFNSENWFWQGFGKLADYFIVSILWLACCIPLVTIGPATIALYDTIAHCVRGKDTQMLNRFFGTFRKELLRGIGLTVLWAAIAFVLNMGYQILVQNGETSEFWSMLSIVYFCTLFLPLGMLCWTVALESRFVYSFGQLNKAALTFTLAYLPQTLVIAAVFVVALNLCMNFPFFVMFLPGAVGHLQSVFIEKVFQKYMPDDGEDSIEV